MASSLRGQIAALRGLPGIRVVARLKPALWRVLAIAYLLVLVGVVYEMVPDGPFRPGGDVWVYAAAGERLNAGHGLYALGAGDREVPLNPPYWTVPLLSPPPIAVLWRPLASVGPSAWALWWLAGVVCSLAVAVAILVRGRPPAIVGLFLLGAALTQTVLSGNAAAFVMPLTFAAWAFRRHPALIGLAVAAATAVKLTPVLLCLWLLWSRRWRALAVTIAAGAAILAVTLVGAGVEPFQAWWRSLPGQSPSPGSLASMLGYPAVAAAALVVVVAVATMAGLSGARRRGSMADRSADGAAFAVAVVAATVATPALWFTATSFAVAALSPLVPLDQVQFPEDPARRMLDRARRR